MSCKLTQLKIGKPFSNKHSRRIKATLKISACRWPQGLCANSISFHCLEDITERNSDSLISGLIVQSRVVLKEETKNVKVLKVIIALHRLSHLFHP